VLEAGLSFIAPAEAASFRWLGAGPYAGFPGKDMLNEFGRHHLNREDLYFQGNRRQVDAALLARSNGSGLALLGSDMDISVERVDEGTTFSHNACSSTEFWPPRPAPRPPQAEQAPLQACLIRDGCLGRACGALR
jgi:hypothetical protein